MDLDYFKIEIVPQEPIGWAIDTITHRASRGWITPQQERAARLFERACKVAAQSLTPCGWLLDFVDRSIDPSKMWMPDIRVDAINAARRARQALTPDEWDLCWEICVHGDRIREAAWRRKSWRCKSMEWACRKTGWQLRDALQKLAVEFGLVIKSQQ
jgi:hypothetical protein